MTEEQAIECGYLILALWPKEKLERVVAFQGNIRHADKAVVERGIREAHKATPADGFCPWAAVYAKVPAKPTAVTHDNVNEILAARAAHDARVQAAIEAWKPLTKQQREAVIRQATANFAPALVAIELRFIERECPSRTVWAALGVK